MVRYLKYYGIGGCVYLVYCKFRTWLTFRSAKIIRFPIDIRGKKSMQIGRGFVTGKYCRIEAGDMLADKNENKNLIIGQNVQINDFCHFTAYERVEIGDNVLIASKVYISDVSHGQYGEDAFADSPLTIPQGRKLISNPVKIESNVWLGEGVCVLPGVTIGCGSIIGANAVVNTTIPPYCIAVGVPAKVVKKYSIEQKKWIKVVNE